MTDNAQGQWFIPPAVANEPTVTGIGALSARTGNGEYPVLDIGATSQQAPAASEGGRPADAEDLQRYRALAKATRRSARRQALRWRWGMWWRWQASRLQRVAICILVAGFFGAGFRLADEHLVESPVYPSLVKNARKLLGAAPLAWLGSVDKTDRHPSKASNKRGMGRVTKVSTKSR